MSSSVATGGARGEDARIRALRPPKPAVDPWKAHGSIVDDERRPGGAIERALTVFLSGAECPFTCAFCDLWRWTTDADTPVGALPRQVADALAAHAAERVDRLKLYNASNFFDRRAVPDADVPALIELAAPFAGVTVESHVNTIGAETLRLADRLAGRLEVAVGLETIHPVGARHLNKKLDLARFDRAARLLADHEIDLRVFVLLGAPYVPAEESVEWAVRTARFAAERGAAMVAIIPVRGGNGEMERIAALGAFAPPTLAQLEASLDACADFGSTVATVDLWDAERLPACESCRTARIERMRCINVIGRAEPRLPCAACGT